MGSSGQHTWSGVGHLYGGVKLQVADICVEALVEDAARNRVFEVVAQESALFRPIGQLFTSVAFRV